MRYVDPRNVISPKDAVSNIRVIYDGGDGGISVAFIDWNGKETLVMRWNVSFREWDDPDAKNLHGNGNLKLLTPWFKAIGALKGTKILIEFTSPTDILLTKL